MVTTPVDAAVPAAPPARVGRSDVALAVAAAAVSTASLLVWRGWTDGLPVVQAAQYVAATAVVAAPLVVGRRRPLQAVLVLSLILAGYLLVQVHWSASIGPMQALVNGAGRTVVVAEMVAAYLVARSLPLRPAAVPLAVPIALFPIAMLLGGNADRITLAFLASTVVLGAVFAGSLLPAWTAGLVVRGRAERARHRRARSALALAEERGRIARELQQLVLADLAGIAERAEHPGADVRTALIDVAAHGRASLTAMRRLLGMLRGADDAAGVGAPQPTLAHLGALVAGFREGGLDVRLTVSGTPRTLADDVDLAAYRLVQEALRGADRGAPVELTVGYEDGAVRIVADGRLSAASGIATREWTRLVRGQMRQRRGGHPALEIHLPEPQAGSS